MDKSSHIVFFLVVSALIFFLTAGVAEDYIHPTTELDQIRVTNMYMVCDAVAKFLLSIALFLSVSGVVKEVSVAICMVMTNDLADELFFDPLSNGWNEDVLIIFLLGYLILRLFIWHHRKSTKSGTPFS